MKKLGRRIISDKAAIATKRSRADALEKEAALLRREADEMERALESEREFWVDGMMGRPEYDQPR